MKNIIIFLMACGLILIGYQLFQAIKFDTAISLTVVKGPFKGMSFKLMNYKVSLRDLSYQQEFWDSELGKSIFNQLSSTLQTIVKAGAQYIDIELDVNYLGLHKKHYNIQSI